MIRKFLSTFAVMMFVWFSLSGITFQKALTGVFLTAAVALVITKAIPHRVAEMGPMGLLRIIFFVPKLFIYEIINHLKVLRMIYSPHPKIDPEIIQVPLTLEKDLQITSVANAVTLLPGTFTLDYDGKLHIHTIDKNTDHLKFIKKLENEIGRAFS